MKIIPAIDLLDGNVVRLFKGDYKKAKVYNNDPVSEAQKFKGAGFDHIHIVDLNGAREGQFVNLKWIEKIVEQTGLSVQLGGGIRSFEDAELLLKKGVSKVICSSMAVRNRDDWLKLLDHYNTRTILGMDLKDGKVAYAGWHETIDESIDAFLKPMLEHGLKEVLCTDISRDGTLEGPNIELYKDLASRFPELHFIASGGVSDKSDLKKLDAIEMEAVVIGRAYYEKRISLDEMAEFDR